MDIPRRNQQLCHLNRLRSFRPRPVGRLRRRGRARRVFYLLVALLVVLGGVAVQLAAADSVVLSLAGILSGLMALLGGYYRKHARFRAQGLYWPSVPGLWKFPSR